MIVGSYGSSINADRDAFGRRGEPGSRHLLGWGGVLEDLALRAAGDRHGEDLQRLLVRVGEQHLVAREGQRSLLAHAGEALGRGVGRGGESECGDDGERGEHGLTRYPAGGYPYPMRGRAGGTDASRLPGFMGA